MAACNTFSASPTTIPTAYSLIIYGSFNTFTPPVTTGIYYGTSSPPTNQTAFGVSHENSDDIGGYLNGGADTFYYVRCYASSASNGEKTGTVLGAKTYAAAATASTPTSSAVTASTATIACDYYPNVNSSTCSAQLQYKKTTDVDWTNAGSPNTTGGSALVNESENITGLDSSTSYQVRLVITRTTLNGTSVTSASHGFTTGAGVPSITTNAATGVAHASATLNATVAVNEGANVAVYWKWGTDNPPTQNTTASQSVGSDGAYSVGITGLAATTTYYALAYVSFDTPSGSPISG